MSSDRPTIHVDVGEAPLDATALVELVRRPDCGAIVTFEGTVRSPDRGREVVQLDYEAYTQRALTQMRALATSMCERHGARAAAVVHRVGPVLPGESAIVVTVAAPHRQEAFAAASDLLDAVKAEAAIWKREVFPDAARWVGIDDAAPEA